MKRRFKQTTVLLMALLMLSYGCGFKTEVLANTETENPSQAIEQSSQTDAAPTRADQDTKKKSPELDPGEQAILDANNITVNLDIFFEPQTVPDDKKPEVHTGGINLLKVDADDNALKLQGAKFKIYRTEADAKKNINAVKDPANNAIDWEVITDANGIAHFWGLAYGQKGQDAYYGDSTNYWVIETQASVDSEGKPYNLLKYPVKVTVNSNSHAEANKIIVENIKHYDLPYTGGTGSLTPLYMGAALILMAAGMTILFVQNKRNSVN